MSTSLIDQTHTNIWVHFNYYQTGTQSFQKTGDASIGFRDIIAVNNGSIRLFSIGLPYSAINGEISLKLDGTMYASDGVTNTYINGILSRNKLCTLDFNYIANGSVHKINMYNNGVKVTTLSYNNTSVLPATTIQFSNITSNSISYFSELIVTGGGESTLGWRLASMTPTANGTVHEWKGNFADLATSDATTGISTNSANKHSVGIFSSYKGAANPLGIRALSQFGRYIQNDSGLKIEGTLYSNSQMSLYDKSYTNNYTDESRIITIWNKNPVSNAEWTTSDFTNFQSGFKSVANT
jgi:hypothetical protein